MPHTDLTSYMKDTNKTKKQLLEELAELRVRLSELEVEEAKQKRGRELLSKLNKSFLSLGPDSRKNIETLATTAGELLGGACMLYNRLDRERGMLCTWGIWQEPEGYKPEDPPEGHICYDVIRGGGDEPVIIKDLTGTKYERTDPNVKNYKLKSYLGVPVKLEGKVVGSFCLCDVVKRKFTDDEVKIATMLAQAVAGEEVREITAEKLRKSEEKYREMIDGLHEAVYRMSLPGGEYEYFSPAVESIFGYSAETFLDNPMFIKKIIHPDSQDYFKEKWADLLRGNLPPTYEYKIVDPEGNERWILQSNRCLFDDQGSFIAIEGICQNITERKRAEKNLFQKNEQLELVMQGANIGWWDWDIPSGKELYNDILPKLLGYKLNEIEPDIKWWEDKIHPDDLKQVRIVLQEHFDGKTEFFINKHRLKSRTGKWKWFFDHGKVVSRDKAGKPIRMIGTLRDIDNQHRSEEALRESEERFRNLMEYIPGISIQGYNTEGTVRYWNKASEHVYGYTAEEAVGKNLGDLIIPEDVKPQFLKALEIGRMATISDELLPAGEVTLLHKDGSPINVYSIHTVVCIEGKETLMFCLDVDLSERKRLEEQLRHVQKMEAIGTLAGGIAHDFNNILAGIMGYATLVKRSLDRGSPLLPDMDSIERLSQRAADLTGALLAFARKGKYNPQVLNINNVVDNVLKVIGQTAKKGIAIETEMPPDISNTEADEGQIHQFLMNLCINACEAMAEGGTLTIRTGDAETDEAFSNRHPGLQEGPCISISVSDTGSGMDAGTLERIFEPFYTTKEEKAGTGMGLAMVIGIVEGHGGCIEVESEPGEGSTFTVYLPATSKNIQPAVAKPIGTLRGDETILVVDDEKGFRDSIGRCLKELGYTLFEAASGEEALKVIEGEKDNVDLVLLDMIMEGMSGAETFARMREIVPDLPIIICTGYTLDKSSQHLLKREPCSFIQKPVMPDDLTIIVRKLLDKR